LNYFSHFFVDGIDNQHEYNTGLLLPDITRGKIKSFRHLKLFNSASNQNFFNGCIAHYHADKKFHASEFFNDILSQSSLIINKAKFNYDLNRKWFLAHILAELMLDRILVRMYPEMLHKFYNSLNSISDYDLSSFLSLYGMKDVEEFFEFFNHFRKVKYIYYYTDNNKFVYSLNRIMIKAGVTPISDFNQEVLCDAALLLEEKLIEDKSSLIINLKQSIQW
jgi:hypothetical protein